MNRKVWSEVELSTYLDGQLSPVEQRALEATMAQDAELRGRVDALRQAMALMKQAPLREPPRNYLLTPAMINAGQPERAKAQQTWGGLLWMRVATTVTAIAFVVTMGLNIIRVPIGPVGFSPSARMMAEEAPMAPERAIAEVEQLPPVLATNESESPDASREVEMESLAAPQAMDSEDALTSTLTVEIDSEEEAMVGIAALEAEAAEEVITEREWVEAEPEMATLPVPEGAYDVHPIQTERAPIAAWIPTVLGVATLLLAGVTFWIARRR